jgi:sugar/nucleoside kinase (ribokinase family)
LGGTASYSSLVAHKLGLSTAVLTSVGQDFEFFQRFDGIQISNKESTQTTVFENIYEGKERIQYVYTPAKTLFKKDLPQNWKDCPLVHFGAIANEIDFSLLGAFPNALKGATIQGWLRQWDEAGKVSPKAMDWEKLEALEVVIMSNDDIRGFEDFIPKIVELVEVLVMTEGENGAIIFNANQKYHFPAYPIKEIDPTGAGDVFAVSFLIEYSKNKNIKDAMAFAHSAAAFVVENKGVFLPDMEKIQDRMKTYQMGFKL